MTEQKPLSLVQVLGLIDELYSDRNDKFLPEHERLQFLLLAVGTLGKNIRKGETDKFKLARSCASIFSRARAYVLSSGKIHTVEALSKKYPSDKCGYCCNMPCSCKERRTDEITLSVVSDEQLAWTISDWCINLDRKYGENNRARGIDKACARLLEEVVEFITVKFEKTRDPKTTRSNFEEELSLESADMNAWIFTIVAMLGIIPEFVQIIHERYCTKCHRCSKRPCDCGPIDVLKERSYTTQTPT